MVYYRRSPLQYHPLLTFLAPYSSIHSPDIAAPSCSSVRHCRLKHNTQSSYHVDDKNDALTFTLDVPGVKRSDVEVHFHDSVLTVEAKRNEEGTEAAKRVYRFLIRDTSIVDYEKSHAVLSDGVLTVTVPKKTSDVTVSAIPIVSVHPSETQIDTERNIRFTVDLPGVKLSDLTLNVTSDSLTLHAERSYGERVSSIDKEFTFDQSRVDAAAFEAFLVDGVLTIIGKRKDLVPPHVIPVTSDDIHSPVADPSTTTDKEATTDSSSEATKQDGDRDIDIDADAVATETPIDLASLRTKADDFVVVETVEE